MGTQTTDPIFSSFEKDCRYFIERASRPEKALKTHKEALVVPDEMVAGARSVTTMKSPNHSMSFINDKEVKMASRQRIPINAGDLAKQKVSELNLEL